MVKMNSMNMKYMNIFLFSLCSLCLTGCNDDNEIFSKI